MHAPKLRGDLRLGKPVIHHPSHNSSFCPFCSDRFRSGQASPSTPSAYHTRLPRAPPPLPRDVVRTCLVPASAVAPRAAGPVFECLPPLGSGTRPPLFRASRARATRPPPTLRRAARNRSQSPSLGSPLSPTLPGFPMEQQAQQQAPPDDANTMAMDPNGAHPSAPAHAANGFPDPAAVDTVMHDQQFAQDPSSAAAMPAPFPNPSLMMPMMMANGAAQPPAYQNGISAGTCHAPAPAVDCGPAFPGPSCC